VSLSTCIEHPSLSALGENKVVVGEEGGISAIVRAMGTLRDDEDIQRHGSSCFLKFSRKSELSLKF
jgi:hypothetical protein